MTKDERKGVSILINLLMASMHQLKAKDAAFDDLFRAAELLGLTPADQLKTLREKAKPHVQRYCGGGGGPS